MKISGYLRKATEIPKFVYGLPSRIKRESTETAMALYEIGTELKNLPYKITLRAQRPIIQQLIKNTAEKAENKPARRYIGILRYIGGHAEVLTPSLSGWSLEAYSNLLDSERRAETEVRLRDAENKLAAIRFKEYLLRISEDPDPRWRSNVKVMPNGSLHFIYGANTGIVSGGKVYYREIRSFAEDPKDISVDEATFVADARDVMEVVEDPMSRWEVMPPESIFTHSHWYAVMEEVGERLPKTDKQILNEMV